MTQYNVLCGIEYALGEQRIPYAQASGFAESGIPDKPDLWGWGYFYKANTTPLDLMIQSSKKSLKSSGVSLAYIDAVILCCASFPDEFQSHTDFMRQFLDGCGLKNVFSVGLTLNGCASFLSATHMANALVRSGQYKNVLIASADIVPDSEHRFQQYGIFSDAASSVVVSAQDIPGWELFGLSSGSSTQLMNVDAPFNSELAKNSTQDVLNKVGIDITAIRKIFCNNLFTPIATMKELEIGFDLDQLYLNNIKAKGHCFSTDTLINLYDYEQEAEAGLGDYCMLAVDSPGNRTLSVLRKKI